ncbi:MAG: hypothetical protein L6U99_04385 [Clostridium sp.]|nr:MAG: hypothetical protein L6U99_04385 [Clostridium sp.]
MYVDNATSSPVDPVNPTPSDPVISSDIVHNFEDGTSSSFFTIVGNMKANVNPITYNNMTLAKALKMESSTSIKFKIDCDMTLVLVTDASIKKIKINKNNNVTDASGILTIKLTSGEYEITKGDQMNVFYVSLNK